MSTETTMVSLIELQTFLIGLKYSQKDKNKTSKQQIARELAQLVDTFMTEMLVLLWFHAMLTHLQWTVLYIVTQVCIMDIGTKIEIDFLRRIKLKWT